MRSSNVEFTRSALSNSNRPESPNFKPLKSKHFSVVLFINIEDKTPAVSGTHLHQFNLSLVKVEFFFNPLQIASTPTLEIRKFPKGIID